MRVATVALPWLKNPEGGLTQSVSRFAGADFDHHTVHTASRQAAGGGGERDVHHITRTPRDSARGAKLVGAPAPVPPGSGGPEPAPAGSNHASSRSDAAPILTSAPSPLEKHPHRHQRARVAGVHPRP